MEGHEVNSKPSVYELQDKADDTLHGGSRRTDDQST